MAPMDRSPGAPRYLRKLAPRRLGFTRMVSGRDALDRDLAPDAPLTTRPATEGLLGRVNTMKVKAVKSILFAFD